MRMRSCVVLTLVLALASAGLAFAGGSAEQPTQGKSMTVALVVKSKDDAWKALQQGGDQAARDLGSVEVTYQEPDSPTAASQAQIVDGLVKLKVNAIVLAPSETGAAIDPLLVSVKKAVDAGIKVVSLDQSLAAGGPLLDVVSPTEAAIGAGLVKAIASQIGDSGEVGIISAAPDAPYQGAVIDGIKKELAAHPNLHLDAILYGNDLPDRAGRETAAMLKAYPNMKGIIAPTTVGLEAAAKALRDAGQSGKVQLTGLGVPADMKPYFDDGTCTQMLLGVPIDAGYLATYAAAQLARGSFKGNRGENLKAGRLGTLGVTPAGQLELPAPTVVTGDTIDSFIEGQ